MKSYDKDWKLWIMQALLWFIVMCLIGMAVQHFVVGG
jgi:hypothetical protein